MTSESGGRALSAVLTQRFQRLHQSPPAWASPFPPSCPLVGKDFEPGNGLFVYASAENFSWMTRQSVPERFKDARAWNRYRACYEELGVRSANFFPDVGIQPVTDGGLLAAALFISERLELPRANAPRVFLELASFSNWGKFTITPGTNGKILNRDYVDVESKLSESLPFVVTELATLQPAVVLLPSAIWKRPLLRGAMRGAAPFTKFVAIPQFNSTVVNCHLTSFNKRGLQLRRALKRSHLSEWMGQLKGFHEKKTQRVIRFLDKNFSCGLTCY